MLLQSTECFHIVHLECFKKKSIEALIAGDTIQCPNCNANVTKGEMRGVLLPEDLEMIEAE